MENDKEYIFNDAIFNSDTIGAKTFQTLISIEIQNGICTGVLLTKEEALKLADALTKLTSSV